MKILIIAYYYPPLNTGGTMRPFKMAKYLSRMGHQVSVLTHTYGKDHEEGDNPHVIRVKDISFNKERISACKKVRWLTLRLFTESLNLFGIYHTIYSWWKRRAVKKGRAFINQDINQEKPDIILATYPPVETLEIGLQLSREFSIPLVTDFRDGLLFEPIEAKRIKQHKCISRKYSQIEEAAVRHASAVTTIAAPITDYYRETYQPPHNQIISNAFDPDDLLDLPPVDFDSSHFNIVFTGRFAISCDYNQVGHFFDAVRLLLEKNPSLSSKLRVHLIGEYRANEFVALKDLIDARIIQCHGFVKREKALAFQKAADLLLIITPPDRRSATSAKIFEYLYAGKPILALTHKTVLEDIINETRTGWIVHPHQPGAIAVLMEKIITRPQFHDSFQPDRDRIAQYSVKAQMEKLESLLNRLLNQS